MGVTKTGAAKLGNVKLGNVKWIRLGGFVSIVSSSLVSLASVNSSVNSSTSPADSAAASSATSGTGVPSSSILPTSGAGDTQLKVTQQAVGAKKSIFGLSYFTFFTGPSLTSDEWVTANFRGPTNNSVNTANLISLKVRLTDNFYFDAQTKIDWFMVTNPRGKDPYVNFDRVRVGVSGDLWKSGYWKLSGAANSDIPYFGYTAEQRKLLFSPGLFANLSYIRPDSKWSMWALVQPRVWIYSDRFAVEPEWIRGNQRPGEKFESIMSFSPTVNYAVTEKFGLRSGVTIDYRKTVENDWGNWIRWALPLTTGFTYTFSKALSTYTFVETFPFDGGIRNQTASVNMWISGNVF
jgi:hypothetical protein